MVWYCVAKRAGVNHHMAKATPPDSETEMEAVTSADGTEIAFERTGRGPPLVLVHGNACDHRFWDLSDVRPALAEHCTVYAMDCRGVGESGDVQQTKSAEPTGTSGSGDAPEYDLEREFEDVAAVVDAVDEPVTLLGHSYGALLSLEAALRTDNVHRLVLYEPPIRVGDHELYSEEVLAEMKRLLDDGENEQGSSCSCGRSPGPRRRRSTSSARRRTGRTSWTRPTSCPAA